MKSIIKFGYCALMFCILYNCSNDDDNNVENIINFDNYPEIISEGEGKLLITLKQSKPAKADEIVTINHNGLNGLLVSNVVALDDESLSVIVSKGSNEASFTIEKKNDDLISEQTDLVLEISSINSNTTITLGSKSNIQIELSDDELFGYPKAIGMYYGSYVLNRYIYRADGLLKETVNSIDDEIFSIDKYVYNTQNGLEKVVTMDNSGNILNEISYNWNNGKITESYQPSVTSFYQYNLKGEIETIKNIYIYDGQEYVTTSYYTYKPDGNIEKIENYSNYNGEDVLESSIRYEGYLEKPYAFFENCIIPSISIQHNVFTKLHIEYLSYGWGGDDDDEWVTDEEDYLLE